MNTNKAAYWIALGVFALALNNEYRHGSFVGLHRVSEYASSALCRMATRAEQTLAVARFLTGRQESAEDDLLAADSRAEMARVQSELLRDQAQDEAELLRDGVQAQADVIRAQVETQLAEAEQIRVRMRSHFRLARAVNRRVTVVCPKTGARIVVSAGMRQADVSPDVDDSF
jgi:hypothetical protein